MDREEALRVLMDNMSEATHEHITKIPNLKTWIVDAMLDFAQQQVKSVGLADVGKCVFCDKPPYKEGASYCNEHLQQEDWS